MFDDLSTTEKLYFLMAAVALAALVILAFYWTFNHQSNFDACLKAGGSWKFAGCYLPSEAAQ